MTRHLDFKGRTAVITGAGSGIGAALAAALAARGANLALADINEARLQEVADALKSNEIKVTTQKVDVADKDQIAAFAEAVQREHGAVHGLFNNAGVALGGTFDRVKDDDFEWLMNINFYGVVRMTRAFMPLLKQADMAQLVNVSSIFGIVAPSGQTAYSSAKFAVRGFSNALMHELEGTSIGVTTVHPGGVNTRIAEDAKKPEDMTEAELAAVKKMAKEGLVMPPPEAAEIILRGVERRLPRVLVGKDAHTLAILERIFPIKYWNFIKKRASRPQAD
ncbi:MAG: acetoin dehydrogenase [Oceanicaulis sp.]|uniref:SDR family NAD(P)-dependent oxidoreductase n=1 Tax=unclassified Oceanicaulis TaxID=2632123 RepID=UPI000C66E66C|nr:MULTISPECIES: SDR family oxidoreductase [unclassified Oceanicaulis]MAB68267.1 acetoin dehydrogenase [Oceanicaulis sp.]MBC40518.1 acetoin dehydrogenase [Oceanicaulis sp.]MBG34567.1 acetoin dehydrogenase [Oceanicaulis sp.]HBU61931.1 acetoin dehydrogenase [Oceanicaulis sp.]HCR93567.1 acetoin dehydrogenase [Oceanicaulis sp.]|tara:strand:- start:1740 stop:2573 length:834 start_codon:yes stop_codon:yes gene_type:complete